MHLSVIWNPFIENRLQNHDSLDPDRSDSISWLSNTIFKRSRQRSWTVTSCTDRNRSNAESAQLHSTFLLSFRQELHILVAECLTSIYEQLLLDPFHSFYNNPHRIFFMQLKALKCNMFLTINYDYLHLIVTIQGITYTKLNFILT